MCSRKNFFRHRRTCTYGNDRRSGIQAYGRSITRDYEEAGWGGQWAQHDHGLFLGGCKWCSLDGVKYIACLGDPITDLTEDMAVEQKARSTYEHLIAATDDEMVKDTLRFLWSGSSAFPTVWRGLKRRAGLDGWQ